MPEIGEIKKGTNIGKKSVGKYIWATCIDCGKERWVYYKVKERCPRDLRCRACSNRVMPYPSGCHSHRWKSGRIRSPSGYIKIWTYPDDFFFSMADSSGYILEHRLVVAKALGRCLHRWEIVHHKHAKYPAGSIEDKQDNRYPENLQLVSADRHNQITIMENRIANLEKQVRLLKFQIKELNKKPSLNWRV